MRAYFSIATGAYIPMFEMLKNSLRKFDKITDFILFGENDIKQSNDPMILYRAAPYFAKKLFEQGYTEVCKIDADSLILGNLDHIWEGDYDVGTILDDQPWRVWDIGTYYNNSLVVVKNSAFVDHWLRLCYTPHFDNYQFKEQDLLSILTSDYFNYKVKLLDTDKLHGPVSKLFWPKSYLEDNKVMIDTEQGKKQLVAISWAGGHNSPDKMNYRIKFPESVVKYIEELIK